MNGEKICFGKILCRKIDEKKKTRNEAKKMALSFHLNFIDDFLLTAISYSVI